MRWIHDLLFRLKALLAPRLMEQELDDEIRFHLEMEVEKLVGQGMGEDEARRQALNRFGSIGRQKDRARWSWGVGFARDLQADVRLVGRQMRRYPGFAVGAVLTLALGIGANTAIFSIANQVILRRPAVDDPDRLAAIYTTCRRGNPRCSSSYPDFEDYRDLSRSFLDMAAYSSIPLNVGDPEAARLATGLLVTGNYFGLLGSGIHVGRSIQPSDNEKGAPARVTVLAHGFWRDAFGSDPEIVGKTVRLNGASYTVVGVATEGFRGLDLNVTPDLWLPILSARELGPAVGGAGEPDAAESRGMRWIGTLVGRLGPGVTVDRARADMDGLALRLGEQFPQERAAIDGVRGITVDPVQGYLLPRGSEATLKRFVWMLLAVVGLSLLLAAANLANLLLARATARGREIGIRMAVGAGRTRVVRQLLTESLALSLVGGTAGLLVGKLMLAQLGAFQLPGAVTIGDLEVGLDTRVLFFALGLSVATAFLFGLVPALQTTRPDLVRSLKGEVSGRLGNQGRLRRSLVAVQMGLCVVLLVGSGLFIRTLRNSLATDLGFTHGSVTTARFNLSLLRYSEERGVTFVDELLRRVRGMPEVEEASVSTLVPFQGAGFRGMFAEIGGYEPAPDEEVRLDYVVVEPDYFETLGIELVEGRTVSERDFEGSPAVMVINRHMAERYWPDRSPVGGSVAFAGADFSFEVVGVVDDPVWAAVGEQPTPFVFLPLAQRPGFSTDFLTLVARGSGDPRGLLPGIRDQFLALDPDLSLTALRPLSEQVGDALMPQRMGTVLLGMLGGLALLLAAVGIYGVVSYSVRRRARDIGIRIAVGASAAAIRRAVVREMAMPVLAGLVAGAVVALALSRTIETFMYGVSPNDPLTFIAITTLLVLVALVATLIPARWASRLDPMRILTIE
jgi:predicted permease